MMNDSYHFFGMHVIWWCIGLIVLFWIIAKSFNIFGKKTTATDTPIHILKKRFALGEISKEEFLEKKKLIED